MGIVLAIGPIAGQLYGAKRYHECGAQLHQAMWLALAFSLPGSALLLVPEPFFALSHATPEVAERARGYLAALAFALPASLLFTAFRGFNTAVSRPKAVMVLQLGGLALKVPLSSALVLGIAPLGIPALGVTGCGISTLVAMWAQAIAAYVVLRNDRFYDRFALRGRGLHKPQRAPLLALLRLGVPMGLTYLIEITSFTLMSIFITRLGTETLAGHQIIANLSAVAYMMPLSLSIATSTLVAQSIGARDMAAARRIGWRGIRFGASLAVVIGALLWLLREPLLNAYVKDPAVVARALPLMLFVAFYQAFDAVQVMSAFILRAYKIALIPTLIYAGSLWGVGLGGGYVMGFGLIDWLPAFTRGASGFWLANSISLAIAGTLLVRYFRQVSRVKAADSHAEPVKAL